MKVVRPDEGTPSDIELEKDLLDTNKGIALDNRALFDEKGIMAIDLMGSIGAGKTSLIGNLVRLLKNRYQIAAVAGDCTTTIDADRIENEGGIVIQVNTGKECHLDANIVRKALADMNLENIDLLFIENVGNMICPADFPLGAHKRIVVTSVTEGPWMVVKHPFVFAIADLVVINKVDLKDAMEVDTEALKEDVQRIKPGVPVVPTCMKTGEGIEDVAKSLGL
jgi:hydrogenase nickel incorporation protein HypB